MESETMHPRTYDAIAFGLMFGGLLFWFCLA